MCGDGGGGRRPAATCRMHPGLQALPERSGAELTFTTLIAVRDAVLAAARRFAAGVVLLCGTDTLEEAAFVLHLMLLGAPERTWRMPLCLTGAMLPADQLGSDNAKNLRDAVIVSGPLRLSPCCPCRGHHQH